MIFSNSRYSNGRLGQVSDNHSDTPTIYVLRKFDVPSNLIEYYQYTFKEGDSLDTLGALFLGSADLWYKILDVNPEIQDGMAIAPGTVLRIPQ